MQNKSYEKMSLDQINGSEIAYLRQKAYNYHNVNISSFR